jgi:hypothetical protein
VTILAVLQALVGVVFILVGIGTFVGAALFTTGGINPGPRVPFTQQQLAAFLGVVGAVIIILGIVGLAIAWGLWTLRPWARIVAIILAILGILISVGGVVSALAGVTAGWGSLVFLAIDLLILWYLMRADVRAAFEGRRAAAVRRAA